MKLSDFNFELPEHLIAQEPLKERSSSRLLVLNKNDGQISHQYFKDILNYFRHGDCLVLNDTRVMPARLIGERAQTKGRVEFLLLKRMEKNTWEVMVKPGKKAKVGDVIQFGQDQLKATVKNIVEGGNRIVEFEYDGIFEQVLDQLGEMPLPPYITHSLDDKERYQTVYSKHTGSAAAPTAGLHFTNDILKTIDEQGVKIAYITLHVGLGTFRPVKVEDIQEHKMHSEYYILDEHNAKIINEAKKNGGRIFAVGTTSTRTLETLAEPSGTICASNGWTDIFIYPGYSFKIVDGLITNFHLPESTLIMLVSAFASREWVMQAYKEAVLQSYRFFSFGDAMLII